MGGNYVVWEWSFGFDALSRSVILKPCENRAAHWSMCHFWGMCLGGWDVVGEQKHGSAQLYTKPSDVQLNTAVVQGLRKHHLSFVWWLVCFLGNYWIFHVFCGFFMVSSCAGGQLVLSWGMWSLLAPRKAPKWRLTQSCAWGVQSSWTPWSTSEPESLGRAVRNLLSKLYDHTNKFIRVLTRVCRAKYSGKVWTFCCFPVRIHFIPSCEDRSRWLPYKISLIRMI